MFDFILYTCSYGQVATETISCVEKLHESPHRFRWKFQTGDALISRSRSIAVYHFLQNGEAPYLIFLDGDILFTVEDIEKMLQALQTADCVGGLYPVRGASFLAQRGYNGQFYITGKLEEVQFISTGFMGISRALLEKMGESLPVLNKGNWSECKPFFEDGRYENIFISEDWDFCNKVRDCGSKVYAHTGIQLGHLKERVYTTQEAIEKMTMSNSRSDILEELKEYLGESMPQGIATATLKEKWLEWEGLVEDFYKDPEIGKLYLFDLAGFNSSEYYKTQRLAGILNAHDLNILDIGCGIGTTLLELYPKNKLLLGYDISKVLTDFAEYRANRVGARNVNFTNEFPPVSTFENFDLVVAIDTLEHIEDLESFLIQLSAGMKKGARLYHYDCFWEQVVSPMHFDHSENIDKWLEQAGFVVFDQHWAIKN